MDSPENAVQALADSQCAPPPPKRRRLPPAKGDLPKSPNSKANCTGNRRSVEPASRSPLSHVKEVTRKRFREDSTVLNVSSNENGLQMVPHISAATEKGGRSDEGSSVSQAPCIPGRSSSVPAHESSSTKLPVCTVNSLIRLISKTEIVCYGMLTKIPIHGKAREELLEAPSTGPAVISGCNVFLQDADSTYVGYLERRTAYILHILRGRENLIERKRLVLQFEVCKRHESHSDRRFRSSKRVSRPRLQALDLSAVMYGPLTDSDSMGDFLRKCRFHLQDPLTTELQVPDMLYRNPHSYWAARGDEQKTTKDIVVASEQEPFEAWHDLLSDLEYGTELPMARQPSALRTELQPHQQQALAFMLRREKGWAFDREDDLWSAQKDSQGVTSYVNTVTDWRRSDPPKNFSGGILGDQMGLGKTLSIIALIVQVKNEEKLLMRHNEDKMIDTTLIVVRKALLDLWESQLTEHVKPKELEWRRHHGKGRIKSLNELHSIDIVITTYETLRSDFKKDAGQRLTYEIIWRRIVLDEAHDIRNYDSVTAKAMCTLNAVSRWAVTGTPLQNNISDIASLYKFLRIDPYRKEPHRFFEHMKQLCSQRGPEADSKARRLIRCIMIRRSIRLINLPERDDLVYRLDFNQEEAEIYEREKLRTVSRLGEITEVNGGQTFRILPYITRLRMFCNLGTRVNTDETELHPADGVWDDAAAQAMFNGLVTSGFAKCKLCGADLGVVAPEAENEDSDNEEDGHARPEDSDNPLQSHLASCSYLLCGTCTENKSGGTPCCTHFPPHDFRSVSTLSSCLPTKGNALLESSSISTKVKALLQDLEKHLQKEKCIVFSFWTTTLDVIEEEIKKRSIGYIRFDGKVADNRRRESLKEFKYNETVCIALLTVSCGAVGLDLTSASRAYLMEPQWNPSSEQQAFARVYRMGQQRNVTTVRYIMRDSIEENVLDIQDRKQELANILLSADNKGDSKSQINQLQHFHHLVTGRKKKDSKAESLPTIAEEVSPQRVT